LLAERSGAAFDRRGALGVIDVQEFGDLSQWKREQRKNPAEASAGF
jgi:hypothetical protein